MIKITKKCLHCFAPLKEDEVDFCCLGCKTAYKMIAEMGFKNYYDIRDISEETLKIKPIDDKEFQDKIIDITEFAQEKDGVKSVSLMVQGLHCGACVWLIENILKKQPNVIDARINLSRKTLSLSWSGSFEEGNNLIKIIYRIGYKLLPFDIEILNDEKGKPFMLFSDAFNQTFLHPKILISISHSKLYATSVAIWIE